MAVIAHSFGCPAVSLAVRRGFALTKAVVYLAPPDSLELGARTFARVTGIGDQGFLALARPGYGGDGLTFDGERVENFGPTMSTPLLLVHDEQDQDVNIAALEPMRATGPTVAFTRRRVSVTARYCSIRQWIDRIVRYVHAHRFAGTTLDRSLQELGRVAALHQ